MAGELEGRTILLVDDDRDILSTMGAALSELGLTIITATDGNSAVTQVQDNSPDLVVLDQMLPKRSGFLVMEHIKRSTPPDEERPKVIMITGNPGSRHKIYAKSNPPTQATLRNVLRCSMTDSSSLVCCVSPRSCMRSTATRQSQNRHSRTAWR